LLLDPATGELLDSWDGLNADIRSTVVYDAGTDAYYFTSKGGTFYSVQVTGDRKLTNKWSVNLANGVGGVPMSTSTPVVYGGRAYGRGFVKLHGRCKKSRHIGSPYGTTYTRGFVFSMIPRLGRKAQGVKHLKMRTFSKAVIAQTPRKCYT
jgi:hypothetical protein